MKILKKLFTLLFGAVFTTMLLFSSVSTVKAATCSPIVKIGTYLGSSGGHPIYYM